MRIYYDLHIHTALSPCGDRSMTPNNIVNMAMLKGLDTIAITDHNSTLNCEACIEVAKDKDIIVIPGIELQTKEEVHCICLFKNLSNLKTFQGIIDHKMIDKENRPDYFGEQLVFDKNDNIVDNEKKLLMASVDITLNKAFEEVMSLDGILIPAHVDKSTFSIISNLGFIPINLDISTIECSKRCDINELKSRFPYLDKYKIVTNSDAHYLGDLSEKENYIDVGTKNINEIIEYFKAKKG